MLARQRMLLTALVVTSMLATSGTADAAIARYHFVPSGAGGAMVCTPATPVPYQGEKFTFFGVRPDVNPPRPTTMMTYQHPFSGQPVVVPLALPTGTPDILHRGNARIIYNYGGYTVSVEFLADGSVNVIYNSGFLRGI